MIECYLLFAGAQFYPYGGIEDFKGVFESVDSAKRAADTGDTHDFQWAQIVRKETLEVVLVGDRYTLVGPEKTEFEWDQPDD